MSIGYYQIRSPLPQLSPLEIEHFLRPLSEALGATLQPVSIAEYQAADFGLLYVASGGSENYFYEVFEQIREKPCYILASGESNSLAASMEILSFLQARGCRGEILHGDIETIAARIGVLRAAALARKSVCGRTVGAIGTPSDWLIASDYSAEACAKKLSIDTVHIPMDELIAEIAQARYTANAWTERLQTCAFDSEEIEKSLRVYGALTRIVERYGLSALTVRCFDLLTRVHATGCVGLAILNANGVYAGCEGDMPALLSMLLLGEVSQRPVFQCNPNRIDTREGTVLFAHCTLPLNMPESFTLDTHFESKIGVAIAGDIPDTPCTVFKASGDVSRYFVTEGEPVRRPYESSLCRTQLTLRVPDTAYFLKRPIGNHHIVCNGRYADAMREFFCGLA